MPRGKKSKKKNIMLDLQVVALIVLSILLAVLIYTKSGYIGEHLSPILGGIMGWIKYIIPIGTFAIAIFIAKNEDIDNFSKKMLEYAVLLLCITVVITVIQAYREEIYLDGKFEDVIEKAYYQGTINRGGGAVGACFAFLLAKLLR